MVPKIAKEKQNKQELSEIKNNLAEESREKRIQNELNRIAVFYANMEENQKAVITPLLQNSAFMKVTLEDLQQLIVEEGVTDYYQNGANQHGRKQSASLQAYNTLVKNYAAITKTLSQMLPPEKKTTLPPVVLGKTLIQWKYEKEYEEKDNPSLMFMSLEDWLKEKLQEGDSYTDNQ